MRNELPSAPDPGQVFFAFLSRVISEGSTKRDFMEALSRTGADLGRTLAGIKGSLVLRSRCCSSALKIRERCVAT